MSGSGQAVTKRAVRCGVVAMVLAIGVLVPSTAAMAGNSTPKDKLKVEQTSGEPSDPAYPGYPGDPGVTDSAELAFTGDSTLELAFLGIAVVGLGVVLLRLGRRPARV